MAVIVRNPVGLVACAILALPVFGAGCFGSGEPTLSPPPTASDPVESYLPGIYYGLPGPAGVRLAHLEGGLVDGVRFGGVGFALSPDLVVSAEGVSSVRLIRPGQAEETLTLSGVYHVARPSLSGDGTRIVLQASEDPAGESGPQDLNIYLVDLETGETMRLSTHGTGVNALFRLC